MESSRGVLPAPVRVAVLLACLVPLALLVRDGFTDGLGPNPVEAVTHRTGDWALRLLLATLAVSPLGRLTGWAGLDRLRRMLGLLAFTYAALHVLVWVGLDQRWSLSGMGEALVERPYIALGLAAFVLMLPLAVTSTRGWRRRLGAGWRRLHRLVFPAAGAAVLHFLWLVRADYQEPAAYAAVLVLLLAARVRWGEDSKKEDSRQ
ncbi:MAG: protein-methionine-sulfoxide reductase heme-binding subunit MsrQ [Chromatiales bacterium]|jgi:sulfoxide reductase heme-binding subunit YedZ